MRYLAEWREDAPNVAPEERATVADFRLWLDHQNVAMHLLNAVAMDHLTIPLYALASGLAHDWWSLFGGRDRDVALIRHRSGYALPDLRLRFDGAVFEISAYQRSYSNPPVRFWAGPTEVMPRAAAEELLGGLIECVLDRLAAKDVRGTSASLRWARVQASRADAGQASFCEAAGALGLDPYQIDDRTADWIEGAAETFEGEPLAEFLAGAGGADRDRLLGWVHMADRRPPAAARVADLASAAGRAAENAPARHAEAHWSLGYRRARSLRRVLALGADARFRSFRSLAERLGASRSYALAGSIDGMRALRSDHADGVRIHMRSHGRSFEAQASHLFSFARAVGDVACFPAPAKAPVNELRAAYRQATGRAFAAEFLAPVDEVLSMRDDGHDSVFIANEFAVSTAVIERQIGNATRIAQACA